MLVLVTVLVLSLFLAVGHFFPSKQNSNSPFFVGVEIGWRSSVADCKALIDRVKDYTNLLIIASSTITCDEASLDETCDYAYNADMYLMVYFGDLLFSPQEAVVPNSTQYYPYEWIMQAKERYGDHFLGAYYGDELGGARLDTDRPTVIGIGAGANQTTSYMDAANSFVQSTSRSMDVGHPIAAPLFTSDYALYWFDYKAGYDVVLAEFAWNNSRLLQVALCRGAARIQNQEWGVMITWTYAGLPYLESGAEMYDDMVLAYNSGAKYVAVYDASHLWHNSTLTEDHFDALENFWNYVQHNPDKHGSLKADVALVLPRDYGFGFRTPIDSIWGFKQADAWTEKMYNDVNDLLNEYGSSLDIVYDDPTFSNALEDSYNELLLWTTGTAGSSYPVVNLNSTMGYSTIQEAINSYATYDGHTIFVKAGTYYENVVANKSISLIGEDEETTIICGDNKSTTLDIVCDRVNVTGFTIRDGGNFTSGNGGGILLNNANNCNISGNTVTANNCGIYLQDSSNNTLRNNTISDNEYNFGVSGRTLSDYINDVDSSNTVNGKAIFYWINQRNRVVPSDVGYIALVNCTGMTAQNLHVTNNCNGLLIAYTQNSTIIGNTFTDNWEGIRLDGSSGNVLRDNDLYSNRHNFWFHGGLANDVDTSNRVEGKPIYYWVSQHDKTVPSYAGYVALINCTGITVQNLQLSNNGQGIVLANTRNATVSHNTIMNQVNGIELDTSTNNTVAENFMEANTNCGIAVISSDHNSFSGNTVTGSKTGIVVNASLSNSIYGNNITANGYGIKFQNSIFTNSSYNTVIDNSITANNHHIGIDYGAQNNTFYHNNFIDNTGQISVSEMYEYWGGILFLPGPTNFWDNGSEGNYWSDYTGADANGDGIGDMPYTYFNSIIKDNYPLMQPFIIP